MNKTIPNIYYSHKKLEIKELNFPIIIIDTNFTLNTMNKYISSKPKNQSPPDLEEFLIKLFDEAKKLINHKRFLIHLNPLVLIETDTNLERSLKKNNLQSYTDKAKELLNKLRSQLNTYSLEQILWNNIIDIIQDEEIQKILINHYNKNNKLNSSISINIISTNTSVYDQTQQKIRVRTLTPSELNRSIFDDYMLVLALAKELGLHIFNEMSGGLIYENQYIKIEPYNYNNNALFPRYFFNHNLIFITADRALANNLAK